MAENKDDEKRETRAEKKSRLLAEKIERIRALKGMDAEDIKGYVYRIGTSNKRVALPCVYEILEDFDFGTIYGPGSFQVIYQIEMDGEDKPITKSEYYHIGPEFADLHRQYCLENGVKCYYGQQELSTSINKFSFGDLFQKEKIESAMMIMGFIREMFSNNSQTEIFKALQENNREFMKVLASQTKPQSIPERLLDHSIMQLTQAGKSNPLEDFKSQLDMFETFKGLTEATVERDEMGPIQKMLEKGIEHLPELMEMFKGDARAAGQHFAQEQDPLAKMLLKNPKYRAEAIKAIKRKIGQEKATAFESGYNGESPANPSSEKSHKANGVITL